MADNSVNFSFSFFLFYFFHSLIECVGEWVRTCVKLCSVIRPFFSSYLNFPPFLTFHSLSIGIDPIDRFIHTFKQCRSLLDRGEKHSLKSAVVDDLLVISFLVSSPYPMLSLLSKLPFINWLLTPTGSHLCKKKQQHNKNNNYTIIHSSCE